jgi:hypothetical protein
VPILMSRCESTVSSRDAHRRVQALGTTNL